MSYGRIAWLALVFVVLAACAPNRGTAYQKALAEAQRLHHAGRFEESAAKYDEAAKEAKVPRDAVFMRYQAALVRIRAGDRARAARDLREIANTDPPNAYSAQAAFKAADLAWDLDKNAGYAELEAMALKFPATGVAWVALQRVFRHDDENGGPQKTIAHIDALSPRVKSTNLEELVTYERARRLDMLGKSAEARDAYLDVAARWPYPKGAFFDDSLYRASEMEEKLGRPREAIDHLERLLSFREKSTTIGSYERPRYAPAILRIAKLYEEKIGDRQKAREALHRLYREFTTSTLRDDALWREAALWRKDGDNATACDRLATLTDDFPDSRYVPCVVEQCPKVKRPSKSKAPKACHPYLTREASPHDESTPNANTDVVRPDDPK
jgi:tetratricopeptide (TPR) repeat protein